MTENTRDVACTDDRPTCEPPVQMPSTDATEIALRDVLLEIRALVDATGHPCMMVNPAIVERLAHERLRAREHSVRRSAS